MLPTITTKRLLLRPMTPQDKPFFLRTVTDEEITRYADGPLTAEQAETIFRQIVLGATGVWAIELCDPRAYAGHIGLRPSDTDDACEIIFFILPEHWRQGLATEAATALVAHSFSTTEIQQIIATVDPEHAASRRVVKKLGMTIDRWQKDYQGIYPVYMLTRSDWEADSQ